MANLVVAGQMPLVVDKSASDARFSPPTTLLPAEPPRDGPNRPELYGDGLKQQETLDDLLPKLLNTTTSTSK
ncbi:hypothetical protein NX059_005006 [Plenodomus lindquistii]|nr:hypothetical protein NX059_005006 [Plenodomus lindquistii]